MNQATLIILMVVAALSFSSGYQVNDWKRDSEVKIADEQAAKKSDEAKGKSEATVQEVLNVKTEYKIKWKTKYKEKLVYIDRYNKCSLDDDSLQLWNEAIADASTKAIVADSTVSAIGKTD